MSNPTPIILSTPMDDRNLQALVERAGRRHAAALAEQYIEDPFRRMKEAPHQGGYPHITPEEWAEYERAMAKWEGERRERLRGKR